MEIVVSLKRSMREKKLIVFLESALENHTDTLKKINQTNFLKNFVA